MAPTWCLEKQSMNVILHLGMPKCGSSALQTYLSGPALQRDTGGRCTYVALHAQGKLLAGPDLMAYARASAYGYCSSHAASVISQYSASQKRSLRSQLQELGKQYETLIFSCEGWGPNAHRFARGCLFADKAFDVTVVGYVRPQMEWLNSAWWQWGAWGELSLGKWIERNRVKALWHTVMQAWAAQPWVRQAQTRLLNGEVVQDFMSSLGYHIPAQPRANQSLPATVLRLFQRNRRLRPGVHDSAIEFVLARQLKMEGGSTPWVLRQRMVSELLPFYRKDNERLLETLPAEQRQKMQGDARWWDAAHYLQRPVGRPVAGQIDAAALEKLTVAALEAVHRLDAQVRQMEKAMVTGVNPSPGPQLGAAQPDAARPKSNSAIVGMGL